MSDQIPQLVQAAQLAANAGRWDEAEKIWLEIRRREPRHPRAAFSLGIHAMQRRDFTAACQLLDEARKLAPQDLFTLLTLAKARQHAGDANGEAEALDAALAIDPYYLPALLAKAQRMERLGARPNAALMYRNAVKIAPPQPQWPDVLRQQLEHARTYSEKYAHDMQAALDTALASPISSLPKDKAERWREAASIAAGATSPYRQEANQLYVPRLPAIPFYDRSQFPWAAALEARTNVIREELKTALAREGKEFSPYIKLRPGQPVDQWEQLNNSARWSHYSLWRNGQPDEAHLAQCPETRRALEAVDMADIGGLCPNAMFSALAPHTEIPPHTGETNARLVAHLPLVVPEKCTYRVGFEHRTWKEGELLIFDDTIEHAARNDSDELRVVLIFDIWNPLIDRQEREVVRALATASRNFNAVR
ncbi:MAG TPA: aspartyl/asparaginyl beta-hydroxylase domain-containing protein [Hyphomonadaceae bacterium]|nr:aspartyl/asparaginyl beta-hydroxylase domain-containing protein [Hyphomonadaceae bacterium]